MKWWTQLSVRGAYGLAVGAVVTGAAVSAAYLAPRTYRSEALVLVEIPAGADRAALAPVQQWPERLRGTLLVASELEPLGRQIDAALDGEAAREQARNSIEVRPVGGRTFAIAFSGPDPASVQRASKLLAARVADRGPAALGAQARTPSDDRLDARLSELASFVTKQPEVLLVGQQSDLGVGQQSDIGNDTSRGQHVVPTVTPVVAPDVTPAVTPAVVSRWNELVLAVTEARRDTAKHPHAAAAPIVTVRVTGAASWPETPVSPNRARIVWLGALFGFGLSALWVIVHTLVARRGVARVSNSTSEERRLKANDWDTSWQGDIATDAEPVPWEPTASFEELENAEPSIAFVDVRWTVPTALYSLDAYRNLRDTILGLSHDHCTVVLVAGATDVRDRKSRVAGRLALALAETGRPRILLLEGDFDNPRVSATLALEMPMFAGLSKQLEVCVHGGQLPRLTVLRCSPSLHVLAEGLIRSPGFVLSVAFETAILALRNYFDVIVIDGPPATASMELHAIDDLVDAVVYADPGLDVLDEAAPVSPDPAISALFTDKRLLVSVSA